MANKDREKIDLTHDELMELWEGVYWVGRKYELKGEKYEQVDKVNTSEFSDGESFDYIIKRESDGKFFKFNVWETPREGYVFCDKFLIEVKQVTKIAYE
jgi:hypothetical protein